jgi:hypothetical protein
MTASKRTSGKEECVSDASNEILTATELTAVEGSELEVSWKDEDHIQLMMVGTNVTTAVVLTEQQALEVGEELVEIVSEEIEES